MRPKREGELEKRTSTRVRKEFKKLRKDLLCLGDRLNENLGRFYYGFVHSKRISKP
jgi:hypothetical protein